MCKASPLGCFPIEQISPFPTMAWLWRICKAAARGLIPSDLPSGGCGGGGRGMQDLVWKGRGHREGREGCGTGEQSVRMQRRSLEFRGRGRQAYRALRKER